MKKITRATEEQKAKYIVDYKTEYGCTPCYPLYGFIKLGEHTCAIEDLRCWSKEDPQYELMAPAGYIFGGGMQCHSLLAHNLKDLRDRAACEADIEKCMDEDGCGCSKIWARREKQQKREAIQEKAREVSIQTCTSCLHEPECRKDPKFALGGAPLCADYQFYCDMGDHNLTMERVKPFGTYSIYVGKGWKILLECPCCRKQIWQHQNFLGGKRVMCDGKKITKRPLKPGERNY